MERGAIDLTGKVCIVTGANSGLGYCTALELASKNATVILACRNATTGIEATEKIKKATNNANVQMMTLDLESIDSVKAFATKFLEVGLPLHLLFNNASVFNAPFSITKDGFVSQFQINVLGPLLLTHLLLDKLKESSPSRIVIVSSQMHRLVSTHFEDLQDKQHYKGLRSYSRTKLYIVHIGYELARRLAGTQVTVHIADPLYAKTESYRHTESHITSALLHLAQRLFGKDPNEVGKAMAWVGYTPELQNTTGKYWINYVEKQSNSETYNAEISKRLFEECSNMCGLSTPANPKDSDML